MLAPTAQELVHAAARRNDMEALGSHIEELEDDRDLRAALLLSAKAGENDVKLSLVHPLFHTKLE
jgi:hypothetical protein